MDVTIPCPCPGSPHESDTVTIHDTLDFRQALTARNAVYLLQSGDDEASIPEILAVLTEQYVLLGVTSWTLTDEAGKPRPVSRAAIRDHLLTHDEAATVVADAADELYAGKVMLPLLKGARSSSPPTSTTDSTYPPMDSGPESPTPSSPSSISTIPTADTATTSSAPAGASSSSLRPVSVA